MLYPIIAFVGSAYWAGLTFAQMLTWHFFFLICVTVAVGFAIIRFLLVNSFVLIAEGDGRFPLLRFSIDMLQVRAGGWLVICFAVLAGWSVGRTAKYDINEMDDYVLTENAPVKLEHRGNMAIVTNLSDDFLFSTSISCKIFYDNGKKIGDISTTISGFEGNSRMMPGERARKAILGPDDAERKRIDVRRTECKVDEAKFQRRVSLALDLKVGKDSRTRENLFSVTNHEDTPVVNVQFRCMRKNDDWPFSVSIKAYPQFQDRFDDYDIAPGQTLTFYEDSPKGTYTHCSISNARKG